MKAVSRLVMALVLSCLSCAAYAQDVDTTDFNALKYTLQKRWRPRNAPFVNGKFSDNLSLRLDAGTEQLLKRSTSDYSLGPIFRLSLGKDVNCLNNVFAGASAGMFRRNSDGVKVFRGGLELGHSFDIASCLWGYDPDRKYGIRTVEAVGVNLSRASGKYSFSASARVGLSLSATIARDFEVFFQPDVTFYTDGIDCSTASNWQKFDFCYGFSIGTLWHFNRYRENPVTDRTFGEWFTEDAWVFFSGGSNFQISQLVLARPGL
ncbi:MAG: hypothetical protein ACI39U_05780, partial [Candidatus Cryptobacteroides sp.]